MAATSLEGRTTCPFYLKLFYRTGAFHRADEFTSAHQLPFVPVYAFPTCSLNELTYHLAAAQEPVLPSPAIGTRVAFRLVYADTRGAVEGDSGGYGGPAPRFVVKDLGSVVIGGGGPGAPASLDAVDSHVFEEEIVEGDDILNNDRRSAEEGDVGHKTLADVRFVVGDYISCAILPPLSNGTVAPASQAQSGRGYGTGEGPTPMLPPSGGGAGRYGDFRGGRKGKGPGGGRQNYGVPAGDWLRGEEVPDSGGWRRGGGGGGGRRRGGGRGGRW